MFKYLGISIVGLLAAFGVSAQSFTCGGYVCEVVADDAFGPSAKIIGLAVDAETLIDGDGVLALPDNVSDGEAEYAVVEIGCAVFDNQLPIKRLILPEYLLRVGYANFGGEMMEEIVFNKHLQEISFGCFNGMKNMLKIDFPDSLEIIDELSFRLLGVVNLKLPNNYTGSCDKSFQEMPNVRNIDFNNLQVIGVHDYVELPLIERIELPEKMMFLRGPSLYNLPALKEVVLPAELEMPNFSILQHCPNVERVYARSVKPLDVDQPLGSGSQYDGPPGMDYANVTLYVPVGAKEAYMSDPMWNVFGHIEEYELSGAAVVEEVSPAVSVVADVLVVRAEAGANVAVADAWGKKVFEAVSAGDEISVPLPGGIYVVCCDGASHKVLIK